MAAAVWAEMAVLVVPPRPGGPVRAVAAGLAVMAATQAKLVMVARAPMAQPDTPMAVPAATAATLG